jgi:hypothetical protein
MTQTMDIETATKATTPSPAATSLTGADKVILGRKHTQVLWHLLSEDGIPRCGMTTRSVYGSRVWEIQRLSESYYRQSSQVCLKCAMTRAYLSPRARVHLQKHLQSELKKGTLQSAGGRLVSRLGGPGRADWTTLHITQKQVDYLSEMGVTGPEMFDWTRGQAADVIDWFSEKKRELVRVCEMARLFAEEEQEPAYVFMEDGVYRAQTETDLLYVYARPLASYDIVDKFEPEKKEEEGDSKETS